MVDNAFIFIFKSIFNLSMKRYFFVLSLLVCWLLNVRWVNANPVNDECTGAINRTPDASAYTDLFSNVDATVSMPPCSSSAAKDIWFKFTATASRHQVISRSINGEPFIAQFFSGECGDLTSILCRDSPNNTTELVNLVPGKTYYYRLYLKNGSNLSANFSTYVTSPITPVNDEATGAIALSLNTTLNTTLGYATQSYIPCNDTGFDAKDVWYKFTATHTALNFSINPISHDELMFEIFSGTPGNLSSIFCSGVAGYEQIKTASLNNLVIGQIYYVSVRNRYGDAYPGVTFKLDLKDSAAPVNDECSGAIERIAGVTAHMDMFNNLGATLSMPACTSSAAKDIWFKFTATATRHQVISRAINDAPFIAQFFSGSCGNLISILCRDSPNGTTELVGLTPGQTYYYRLYLKNGNAASTDFNTYVTSPPMPANDEPGGAYLISLNSTLKATLDYATQTFAPCYATGYDAKDVWFKFVASSTSLNLSVTPVSFGEQMFQVYSGTPDNFTSIFCSGIAGYEQIKTAALTNLVVGNTYYVRVHNRYGDASPSVTFNLDLKDNKGPENDECTGAINIIAGEIAHMKMFNNLGATVSMAPCTSLSAKDIWFKFTATASRHQVISRSINGMPFIAQFFSGSCESLTSILCRDSPNNTTELVGLTPGQTYYYRLYLKNGSSVSTEFNTYVTSWPMPANDEPSGALTLAMNAKANYSLEYATSTFPPCYSTGYDAKDVWYKFKATSTAHNVSLDPISFDELMLQVYSGTENALNSIYCGGIAGYEQIKTAVLTNLSIGATYYVRVHNRYGDASPSVTYSLALTHVVVPPPVITSVSAKGAALGSTIYLYGTNFTGTSIITFGGKSVTDFSVISPTIVKVVLNEALSGDIEITTPSGKGKYANFMIIPVPVISAEGQTTFTIGGTVNLSALVEGSWSVSWYKNGVPINGALSKAYNANTSGNYKCAINYEGIQVYSNEIAVKVIFTLPANNFKVNVVGETCRESNNGRILLTSEKVGPYAAVLTGVTSQTNYSFTNELNINNLSAGNYTLCITVSGEPEYKQCYNLVITEPEDLTVYAIMSQDSRSLNLKLSGGNTYHVVVNNRIFDTSSSELNVPLQQGDNKVSITTDKLCQGVFEQVFKTTGPSVYPNPFTNILNVYFPSERGKIEIRRLDGQLVHTLDVKQNTGLIELELGHLVSGIYVVKLQSDNSQSYFKVIKH